MKKKNAKKNNKPTLQEKIEIRKTEKKRKQKKALAIAAIVLASLAVLAGAGILVYNGFFSDKAVFEKDIIENTSEKNPAGSDLVKRGLRTDDFIYAVYEDGTVTLSFYFGDKEYVNIPETIDGKPVTG